MLHEALGENIRVLEACCADVLPDLSISSMIFCSVTYKVACCPLSAAHLTFPDLAVLKSLTLKRKAQLLLLILTMSGNFFLFGMEDVPSKLSTVMMV